MIQLPVSEQALNALTAFTAYAAGTLLVLDLIGTFVFALSGGMAAVKERLDLFGVLVLSFAAGSAGGIMRDLLVARTPAVLQRDLYAVAALAGSALVVVGQRLSWPAVPTAIGAASVCFALRVLAIWRGWGLPVARSSDEGKE